MSYKQAREKLRKGEIARKKMLGKRLSEDEAVRRARFIVENRLGIGRDIGAYKEILQKAIEKRELLGEERDAHYFIDEVNVRRVERSRLPALKDEVIGRLNEMAQKEGPEKVADSAIEAMKDMGIKIDRFNLPLMQAIQRKGKMRFK